MFYKFNLIYTIVLGVYFYFRYRYKSLSKNVIIYFPQQIGDIILFSNALNKISESYGSKYTVYLLARKNVISFLKDNLYIDSNINLIEIDIDRIKYDYKYVNTISKTYMRDVYKFIVPNYSMTSLLLALRVSSDKICMLSNLRYKSSYFIRYIYCSIYNHVVLVPQDMMELMRYKLLLKSLKITPNVVTIPRINTKNRFLNKYPIKSRYCIISIGASLSEKIWPMKKFAKIILYIAEKKFLDVIICGDRKDIILAKELKKYIGPNDCVKSLVGKTSINEWVDLIKNAEFVIGNDSASIHIATACGVPSICLCGNYDKNQFFPYVIEKMDCILPVVIQKNMFCRYCRVKGNCFGYKNKTCKQYISKNKCALCIEKISVLDVIYEVDKFL